MAVSSYAFALAERFGNSPSKYQPDIFHGMMEIDVYVSFGMQEKIKEPVNGKQCQHVIKKGNTTGNLRLPPAIQGQGNSHVGLFRFSLKLSESFLVLHQQSFCEI
jgi:hypothetical protein